MEKGLVSVITPCYNGESYLDRYFNSILKQTYLKIELIFIDDGSTDSTEEIVNKYEPLLKDKGIKFIYLSQENKGQAAALNYGLKYYSGEYVTWPDADDEMLPECIERKVEFMNSQPQCDLCICKVEQVQEGNPNKILGVLERKEPLKETLFEDLLYVKNVFYVPGGYMARGRVIDRLIPNRDIYTGRGGQNAQLLVPIAYEGNIGYLDDVLYKYYVRENSHSHSVRKAEQIIQQLKLFETILIETLRRMEIVNKDKFIKEIKEHYSHLEYGNAIDSQCQKIIKEQYSYLKQNAKVSVREKLLYIKYGILGL